MSNTNNILGIKKITQVGLNKHIVEATPWSLIIEDINEKGKRICKECYDIDFENNIEYRSSQKYIYDSEFKLSKLIAYNRHREIERENVYSYKQGLIDKMYTTNRDNQQSIVSHEYEDGKLIKVNSYNEKGKLSAYIAYEYSNNTISEKYICIHNDNSEKVIYDSANITIYDEHGKKCVTNIKKVSSTVQETVCEYNGNILTKVYTKMDGGIISSSKYNSRGDIISSERLIKDETVSLYKYDNLYDENNNLALQIQLDLTSKYKPIPEKLLVDICKGAY